MYRTLSSYLKEKYGGKIKKICIDGGFSCPNRDGKCGTGGCIFCGERGAGEHINGDADIRLQVERGLLLGNADGYIAYFQNFTNTYADPEVLEARYSAALFDPRVRVLAIGTRPDCITDTVCRVILKMKERVDVWVELGLQTASDKTAELINRGYPLARYLEATRLLQSFGIPFVTHMIIGLPGENKEDIRKTVEVINASGAFGIKIHSLYVMKGTRLAELYESGGYTPPSFGEYTSLAAYALSLLHPDTVVHRITGDCPRELLLAPEWSLDKTRVINEIRRLYGEMTK